ncbi:MAG: SpoIIE family protein phosphatase [Planctomycetota bacterium]|nr:SpoIIE family protein phosphatase [Planctomycetota bacterium]
MNDDDSTVVRLFAAGAMADQVGKPAKPINVLVIEDSQLDFQLLKFQLEGTAGVRFELVHADRLAKGLRCLARRRFDVVLLDLTLPDSSGIETFQKLQFHAPQVPTIILTGLADESVAIQAAKEGAEDYLSKGKFDQDLLVRSLRYSIARHRARAKLTRALQQAAAKEANLLNIIIRNPDGMLVVDAEGSVIFSNPAAQVLFNRTADELLREPFGLPLLDGESTEVELLRMGAAVSVKLRVVAVDWEGKPAHLAILHDLTSQKQAEQDRLKRLEAEREISVAGTVQQSLFPDEAPPLAGFDIAGAVYPAKHGSGDYYDFIPMADDSLGVVLGDVSGHGLGSALLMARTQAHLRALVETQSDVGQVVTRANRLMHTGGSRRFVTLFFARIAPRARSFNYACAGHQGYLLSAAGDARALAGTTPPLGVLEDLVVASSPVTELAAGDIIVVTTDGVNESMSPDRALFGEQRLLDVVRANRDRSSQEIVRALYKAARKFTEGGRQVDDIAAIVVKVLDSP